MQCAITRLARSSRKAKAHTHKQKTNKKTADERPAIDKLSNSYTIGCPPVRGDNPRALASGLSYVQVDKHGITIVYHLYQCILGTSRGTVHFVLKLVRVVQVSVAIQMNICVN